MNETREGSSEDKALLGLPSVVCNSIFSYLSPEEIVTASQVSKDWSNFSRNFVTNAVETAISNGTTITKYGQGVEFKLKPFIFENEQDLLAQLNSPLFDYLFFIFETEGMIHSTYKLYLLLESTDNTASKINICQTFFSNPYKRRFAVVIGSPLIQDPSTNWFVSTQNLTDACRLCSSYITNEKCGCGTIFFLYILVFFLAIMFAFPLYINGIYGNTWKKQDN